MTQYAYGKTGMVSYDDPRAICDKTEYGENVLTFSPTRHVIAEGSLDFVPNLYCSHGS